LLRNILLDRLLLKFALSETDFHKTTCRIMPMHVTGVWSTCKTKLMDNSHSTFIKKQCIKLLIDLNLNVHDKSANTIHRLVNVLKNWNVLHTMIFNFLWFLYSGVPRNFFRGGGFNKFSWGQRTENGDLVAVAP
jgi:hypothetical protein